MTASYWGISETMIHFVIYESLKKKLLERQAAKKRELQQQGNGCEDKSLLDFVGFMLCGACSKTCATIVAYPHGKKIKETLSDNLNYYIMLYLQRWLVRG